MPSRFSNQIMMGLIESRLHPLIGTRLAVIRVVGRRTGKTYATPINVDREGDGWMFTSLKSRTWWRNLGGEEEAELRLAGKSYTVKGRVVDGYEAVKEGLAAYFERHPKECRYFGVRIGADGRPLGEDLEHAAADRVIVRLRPT